MPKVEKCTCGCMPDLIETSWGHKEAVLLSCGVPDAVYLECKACGYKTANHQFIADAVDEWNKHAKGGAK